MIRKIGVSLLCAGSLFTTCAFSTSDHVFTQGLAIEYELPTNEAQTFSNIFLWTIKAVCTVISDAPDNPLTIKMLRKTGVVNGDPLKSGDLVNLIVHPGDKLYITADPAAKVELMNTGPQTIKASCASA